MASNKLSMPQSRNLRQTIEGMPLIFNASAAGDLQAIIQFNVTGKEPGVYHLSIGHGNCSFHKGAATNPTLTINTPSEVWLQISSGQISGQDALFKGLYKMEGDGSVLLKMGDLFKAPENFTVYDTSEPANEPAFESLRRKPATGDRAITAGKRPAGPIALNGMGWLTLFFIPWTIFWILFDIRSVNPWFSTGIPFILMSLIILYRLVFNKPTWMETASWAFFLVACVLAPIAHVPVFLNWGSIIGSLFVGLMWLMSLSPWSKLPFSAEYSKWAFVKKLWANSMFIQPNMAISLVWGWQFIIACIFGVIARVFPPLFIPFTVLRYGLMIPASIFTARYQKDVMNRKFADIDRTMSNLRIWAYIGVLVILLFLVLVAFALFTPA